jgi:hypothetical protein
MTGALLLQELRFQLRHGFGLAYLLVLGVYLLGLYLVPPILQPALLAFMLLSDPLTVGLIFVGGVVQLEEAMGLTPPLFITPLSPRRFLFNRVLAFSVLGAVLALVLLLLSPEAAFSSTSLDRGEIILFALLLVLPTSAALTLLGAGLAYRVRSVNGYILAVAPLLLIVAAPLLSWLPQVSTLWFVWSPSYLPVVLLGVLFGILELPPVLWILLGGLLFLGWGSGGGALALRMLRRQLRRSVGGL